MIIFLLLSLNPYVLDFFSLARGYGISIAMMMLGILQITKYILGNHEIKNGMYAQLFFSAAVFANLTMIHVLLAFSFLLVINRFVFHRNNKMLRAGLLFSAIPLSTLLILIPYLNHMKAAGAFFYGEEAKSLADTFLSLSKAMSYDRFYDKQLTPLLTILFSAIPLISVTYAMRNVSTVMKSGQGRWLVFITSALFFTIAGPMLQHLLFKTNFLSGRTALFYIPLIGLNLIGLMILSPMKLKNGLLMLTGLFSIIHFSFSNNYYFSYDWKEQADVKQAMIDLKKENIRLTDNCFANILSTDLPFEKQINYYRMRLNLANFSHAARREEVAACSSYYLDVDGHDRVKAANKSRYLKNIHDYSVSGTWLFNFPVLKSSPTLNLVTEVWQDFEHEDPYLELKTDTIYFGNKGTYANNIHPFSIGVPLNIPDSVTGNLVATVNCRLYYYTRNTSALLVFGFDNGNAETWEAMHITELPEGPKTWSITSWTRPVPSGTKKIRVYLWNTDKTLVLMDNVALRLLVDAN